MSSVVKVIISLAIALLSGMASAADLHVLVIGEGAVANCNERRFDAPAYVSQIGLDGTEAPGGDPFVWSDCKGGSIWPLVGEQLHASGFAQRIVFMPVTMEKASLADWSGSGRASSKLKQAMAVVRQRGIRFDYVLVQPGISDSTNSADQYFNSLRNLVTYASKNEMQAKWVIAKGVGCPGQTTPQLERAQAIYAKQPLSNRFSGPDFSQLPRSLASAGCMLNEEGQRQAARMWAASIRGAAATSAKYRKEALLYYFQ